MRVKLKEVSFANGAVIIDLYNINFGVNATVISQPVDGEAGSSRASLWPGEEMTVEQVLTNGGRLWVSGKNPRGERVELDPKALLYIG